MWPKCVGEMINEIEFQNFFGSSLNYVGQVGREQPSVPLRLCGLIGLQITDFSHIEHKDHKGLAKVNPVLDSPIILWCGLCVLCALCGLWLFAELFG